MSRKKTQELIDSLIGTTDSMSTHAERLGLDDMDENVTSKVDAQIFCCIECQWWSDISEEVSEDAGLHDWTCLQCAEENHGFAA